MQALLDLRKGIGRVGPLGAEDERELALGAQAALGRPEGRARLPEVQRAEAVRPEKAVLACHALRLRLSHCGCESLGSSRSVARPSKRSSPPSVEARFRKSHT